MNAYFLEYIINSTSIILVLVIGALIILLLNQNIRQQSLENKIKEMKKDNDIIETVFFKTRTPYVIIDESGTVTNVNEQALKLLDVKRDDIIGTLFDSFIIIQSSDREMSRLNESVKNKQNYEFKTTLRINKEVTDCILKVTGLLQGEEARYLISLNPPHHKRSLVYENNLRDARINRLEEMSGAGFFLYNHDEGEIHWSKGLYKLLGANVNETVPSFNFISQMKTSNDELQNIILSIQDMKPYKSSVEIRGLDGTTHYVDMEITHQEGLNNKNITLGIFKSVSPIDTLLSEFSNESKLFVINNPDFFFLVVTDVDNNIVELNKAFVNYMGKSKEELIGHNFMELFGDAFEEEINNNMFIQSKSQTLVFKKMVDYKHIGDFFLNVGILMGPEDE